jgi:hypothetical protein
MISRSIDSSQNSEEPALEADLQKIRVRHCRDLVFYAFIYLLFNNMLFKPLSETNKSSDQIAKDFFEVYIFIWMTLALYQV